MSSKVLDEINYRLPIFNGFGPNNNIGNRLCDQQVQVE